MTTGQTYATGDSPYQGSQGSTTDVAKDQAATVASGAADAAKNVAGVAKDQATQVAGEARRQVKHLVGQAKAELTDQAQVQQERVATGLGALATQLRSMADNSQEPGVATDLAHQAADKAEEFADWFQNRDPGSVVDELRNFARQRPGVFLASALGAGLLTGRLVRGLTADTDDSSATQQRGAVGSYQQPVRPAVGPGYDVTGGISGSAWAPSDLPVAGSGGYAGGFGSTTPGYADDLSTPPLGNPGWSGPSGGRP